MSQQIHEEEPRGYVGAREYERTYTPTLGESNSYEPPFTGMSAQKIAPSFGSSGKHAPSAGQRLALAIVSMVVLIGALIALGSGEPTTPLLAARLVGVIVVCLATVGINFIFGRRG